MESLSFSEMLFYMFFIIFTFINLLLMNCCLSFIPSSFMYLSWVVASCKRPDNCSNCWRAIPQDSGIWKLCSCSLISKDTDYWAEPHKNTTTISFSFLAVATKTRQQTLQVFEINSLELRFWRAHEWLSNWMSRSGPRSFLQVIIYHIESADHRNHHGWVHVNGAGRVSIH